MAALFAWLIICGKRDFADVPVLLRDQVRNILIDSELAELVDM